jgi:hypothetical protein
MILNTQKPITFENKCGCLVDYELLEKAMLRKSGGRLIARKKTISIHARYPCVAIGKNKYHVHRLIFEYVSGIVVCDGYCVHHIDENKLNNNVSNLKILRADEHAIIHNKGKKGSEKQRECIIRFNHTRKGTRQPFHRKDITYKQVDELFKKSYSINKIALLLNVGWDTVKSRVKDIHDNPDLLTINEDE